MPLYNLNDGFQAGAYKLLRDQGGEIGSAATTAVYALVELTSSASVLGSGNNAYTAFYLDPALHATGSLTTKYNMQVTCITNAVAPAVTFTAGLYPVTASAGASGSVTVTLGAVTAGSTVPFASPAATSQNQAVSGDFTAPAGYFVIGVNNGGTTAASSTTAFRVRLLVRQV